MAKIQNSKIIDIYTGKELPSIVYINNKIYQPVIYADNSLDSGSTGNAPVGAVIYGQLNGDTIGSEKEIKVLDYNTTPEDLSDMQVFNLDNITAYIFATRPQSQTSGDIILNLSLGGASDGASLDVAVFSISNGQKVTITPEINNSSNYLIMGETLKSITVIRSNNNIYINFITK